MSQRAMRFPEPLKIVRTSTFPLSLVRKLLRLKFRLSLQRVFPRFSSSNVLSATSRAIVIQKIQFYIVREESDDDEEREAELWIKLCSDMYACTRAMFARKRQQT